MSQENEIKTQPAPPGPPPGNDLPEILAAIDSVGALFNEALNVLRSQMVEHYHGVTKRIDGLDAEQRAIRTRLSRIEHHVGIASLPDGD